MPKVTSPLFSIAASGSIDNSLTFRKSRRGYDCVKYSQPSGPPSAAQTLHRQRFRRLANAWKTLTPTQQATWLPPAEHHNTTRYAVFIAENWARLAISQCAIPEYNPANLALYDGLAMYCPCDEGAGTQLHNSVTGGFGTLTNTDPATVWTTTPGAITLDGVNDRIDATTMPALDPTHAYTFAAYLRFQASAHGQYIFSVNNAANTQATFVFQISATPQLSFVWFDGAAVAINPHTTATLTPNVDVLLAATYDGSRRGTGILFYIDGSLATGTQNADLKTPTIASGTWSLGGHTEADDRNLSAAIKKLYVWGRVLTALEIAMLATTPPTPIRTL